MKSIPKLLTALFLIVFIVELFGFLFILLAPALTQAQDIKFQPQIDVGTFKKDSGGISISPTSIGEYIKEIYKYAIGAVGILAAVVLMIGGIIWLTSGGNQTRVGEAKSWIGASLTGLIIALCSYLILATINPELIKIKSIEPKVVEKISCCEKSKSGGSCSTSVSQDQCETGWKENGICDANGKCTNPQSDVGCCLLDKSGIDEWNRSYYISCLDVTMGWCDESYENLPAVKKYMYDSKKFLSGQQCKKSDIPGWGCVPCPPSGCQYAPRGSW
jgi:hypothetical protein